VIVLTTVLLMLLASSLINRFVLKNLWRPFYEALQTLRSFKLQQHPPLKLPATAIDEFAFMNTALETTANQAQRDYFLLKEFTENASHEMQTPLAVIRSKLDLLIQNEHLSSYESKALQSSYEAIQKLSRLNQTLLLLAKIDNRQYATITRINLAEKFRTQLDEFSELWEAQHITVATLLDEVVIEMNPDLADILLSNLLSNATRHNHRGGSIRIELHPGRLTISNTSIEVSLDRTRLFTRFYKPYGSNDNTGLGLSIIKQISEASGFQVSYDFCDGLHVFQLAWQYE
jgi:signal transduction histidine kinase